MKKNLLLYILLAFLVVMNGFFLFKHFGGLDKMDAPRRGSGNFIAKQLKFDDAQTKQFEAFDLEHRTKMKTLFVAIRDEKELLFEKLSDKTVDRVEIDSIATVIGEMETTKEIEIFYFFKLVRDLCNEDQKIQFEFIIKDALGGPGPPGREGPPGRDGPPGRLEGEHRPPPR